jgi:hypothetical protein
MPVFDFFGSHVSLSLAVAVWAVFDSVSVYERVVYVAAGVMGLTRGAGFIESLLFFTCIFVISAFASRLIPVKSLIAGSIASVVSSFVPIAIAGLSLDFILAPEFLRGALYSVAAFLLVSAFAPHLYARSGRYKL